MLTKTSHRRSSPTSSIWTASRTSWSPESASFRSARLSCWPSPAGSCCGGFRSTRRMSAARIALAAATNTLYSGNKALGESQLQAAADRYRDTAAGIEAAMVLAQTDFEQARWDDGLKVLDAIDKSSDIENFKPDIERSDGRRLRRSQEVRRRGEALPERRRWIEVSVHQGSLPCRRRARARAGRKDR